MPILTVRVANLQQYMKLARQARGYSQQAAAMRIPCGERSLKRYESGEVVPREQVLEAMERAYKVRGLVDYYHETYEKRQAA